MGFKSISKEEDIAFLDVSKINSIVDDKPLAAFTSSLNIPARKKELLESPALRIHAKQKELKELIVRGAAQPAIEFETAQPAAGSPFLNDDQPVSHQHAGKSEYVWMVPDTNRQAFAFERQASVFRLVDRDAETREASILRMLLQAQQVFGDGCFELSGDDEFVNLANEIAARNNIVMSGALAGPHP